MEEMRPEFILFLQEQQENELQAGHQIWWLSWDMWPLGCQSGKCHTGSEPFTIPSPVLWSTNGTSG